MSLFRSAIVVSLFTLCSRILGYIRDVLMAAYVGTGPVADAFFVAFRLPNFFRQISAEGAFNAAFVPLFAGKLTESGKEPAFDFASRAISLMLLILICLIGVIEIFMPQVMLVLAPGFKDASEQFTTAVFFARVMFPYLLFISLVALLSGVMNSLGRFAIAAAVPMLLSISMSTMLLAGRHYTATNAHALAYGVILAGILQLTVMVTTTRRAGLRFVLHFPRLDGDLKRLLRRMGPGIIGGGMMQINVWINTVIATLIPSAVSYLYYADRLVQFPLALVGTAMGTALLPTLSKQLKTGKLKQAIETQNRALEIALLFVLPAAVALGVLAEPMITLLFQRGEFTHAAAMASAAALVAYSFGLPAFVLVKLFIPSFFAAGDTKTPVKIAGLCLVVNVGLNLLLMHPFAHVGLAMSTSFTSWLNVTLLSTILYRRSRYHTDNVLVKRLPRIALSAAIMGAVLWALQQHFGGLMDSTKTVFIYLCAEMIVGAAVYFIAVHVSGGFKLQDIRAAFKKPQPVSEADIASPSL